MQLWPILRRPRTIPGFTNVFGNELPLEKSPGLAPTCWLVFLDEADLGTEISNQLKTAGHEVIQVTAGTKYHRIGAGNYVVNPATRGDYDQLFSDIGKNGHSTH